MERSESIKEIATALCSFQSKVGKIKKESNNPFFKSKYASLAKILDIIQEPLTECGLSIMQMPMGENELETIVMHKSGEFISSSYLMKPVKNDPQGVGSCITYQRRYALGAALSLNIDEDDDGNKASGNDTKKTKVKDIDQMIEDRKIPFTKEVMSKPTFFPKIYKNESDCRDAGEVFSLKSFMQSYYKIDDVGFDLLVSAYSDYKTNNNLL